MKPSIKLGKAVSHSKRNLHQTSCYLSTGSHKIRLPDSVTLGLRLIRVVQSTDCSHWVLWVRPTSLCMTACMHDCHVSTSTWHASHGTWPWESPYKMAFRESHAVGEGSLLEKTEKEVLFIFLLFNVKPETIEKLLSEMCRMRRFPRSLKLESALDLQSFGTGPSWGQRSD